MFKKFTALIRNVRILCCRSCLLLRMSRITYRGIVLRNIVTQGFLVIYRGHSTCDSTLSLKFLSVKPSNKSLLFHYTEHYFPVIITILFNERFETGILQCSTL